MGMRRFMQSTTGSAEPVLAFVFEVNTANTSTGSSTATQFQLPLEAVGGVYDFNVDWGDTSNDNITVWDQAERTHTYTIGGTYTITITGDILGFSFRNTGDRLKILDIQQWGVVRFNISGNVSGAFYGCANLQVSATDIPVLPNIPGAFFRNCTALTGNSSFNNWNLNNVTNLGLFFQLCSNFNANIADWDVSNVTTFASMFSVAPNFNQNIGGWDVGSAVDFNLMFNGATAFNQNLNLWNVSGVTNFTSMFLSATNFNGNITSWNVGLGSLFTNMFQNAVNFNQNIGGWNVSSATNMINMLRSATAFNQNISTWNVSNVTTMNNFMLGKTNLNYSASNLDAIYNTWSLLTLQPNVPVSFGTIKYTAAGQAGKDILEAAPNLWIITDGGI